MSAIDGLLRHSDLARAGLDSVTRSFAKVGFKLGRLRNVAIAPWYLNDGRVNRLDQRAR
jgi:hypothetical protein